MAVQLYIDDSYKPGGVHVLAGYMARAEDWALFSRDWEELLPACYPNGNGKLRFKMSEMARRMDDVRMFASAIRKHLNYRVSIMMREDDLHNAIHRIWSPTSEILFGPEADISNLLVRFFLSTIFEAVIGDHGGQGLLSPIDKIDIYFDKETAADWSLDQWEDMVKNKPEYVRDYIGGKPQFLDDEEFMPLQSADFLAWWIRRGYENGNEATILDETFGSKDDKVPKTTKGFNLMFDEDQITSNLIDLFKSASTLPAWTEIYDAKVKPRNGNTAMDVYGFEKRNHLLSYFKAKLKSLRTRR
jgi:hypothetical protein